MITTLLERPRLEVLSFGHRQVLVQLPNEYNAKRRYPLILFFHGETGNIRTNEFTADAWEVFRDKAAERGYLVACPGYGGESWMNMKAETLVMEVLEFLKFKFPYDRRRIYVMGVSAGASAALTFTLRHKESVAAVAELMGAADLVRLYREGRFAESLARAYGGSPEEKPHTYRLRSPMEHTFELERVPMLIIHGDSDSIIPVWHAETLYRKLGQEESKARLIKIPDAGHEPALIRGLEDTILDCFDAASTR